MEQSQTEAKERWCAVEGIRRCSFLHGEYGIDELCANEGEAEVFRLTVVAATGLSTAVRIHVVGRNEVFSRKRKGFVSLGSQFIGLREFDRAYFVVEGKGKVGSEEGR